MSQAVRQPRHAARLGAACASTRERWAKRVSVQAVSMHSSELLSRLALVIRLKSNSPNPTALVWTFAEMADGRGEAFLARKTRMARKIAVRPSWRGTHGSRGWTRGGRKGGGRPGDVGSAADVFVRQPTPDQSTGIPSILCITATIRPFRAFRAKRTPRVHPRLPCVPRQDGLTASIRQFRVRPGANDKHPTGEAGRGSRSLRCVGWLVALACLVFTARTASADPPAPPTDLRAVDHPWDGGEEIDLDWTKSIDDREGAPWPVAGYLIRAATEKGGEFVDAGRAAAGATTFTVEKLSPGTSYRFEVIAVGGDDSRSVAATAVGTPGRQVLDGTRMWVLALMVLLCGTILVCVALARAGWKMTVRRIAALDAVDEAVGRATEMGRPLLYVPGIQDMNEIDTIAGLTVLAHVARTVAEYDARIEVPTSRSLVMTAARETTQAAFLAAGRPDSFNPDLIYYVTDEQFGFVAYLTGLMTRQKPAACFYLGKFFAESLILAETGNSIGAIQIAGTSEVSQLPFFVAGCDYTLLGEEFFAASAYLSGEPDQLGSLKGQDVGKVFAAAVLVVGVILATIAAFAGEKSAAGRAVEFLTSTVLQ